MWQGRGEGSEIGERRSDSEEMQDDNDANEIRYKTREMRSAIRNVPKQNLWGKLHLAFAP